MRHYLKNDYALTPYRILAGLDALASQVDDSPLADLVLTLARKKFEYLEYATASLIELEREVSFFDYSHKHLSEARELLDLEYRMRETELLLRACYEALRDQIKFEKRGPRDLAYLLRQSIENEARDRAKLSILISEDARSKAQFSRGAETAYRNVLEQITGERTNVAN